MTKTQIKRKPRNYINNAHMHEALVEYLKTRKASQKGKKKRELPTIPDYLGKCFMELSRRIGTKGKFRSYSYLDEMIQDAVDNCIAQIHTYNPEKSVNAFAYFSTIIINAFIRRIKREKKMQYMRIMNRRHHLVMEELAGIAVSLEDMKNPITNEFIREFEASQERAKQKVVDRLQARKDGISKFVKKEK